jgi:putative transposase
MTRQFKKLAHSLYKCKYHVVFCPKYRYRIMQDEVARLRKLDIRILALK